ncbi:protein TIC 22, chloroplastic-like isoform X1 [Actinidia eriantha]|uniref:protein TIC 22, chloroplastic-like isoform X1 n=1 Tax=Actinidia eriantha TaxID=165200 RepID=UPI0025862AF9|nr:protein TIC 22, chloroplastic-like isoform X1 [Actinidia eriantha]
MEAPKPSFGSTNPLLSLSSFIHQHCQRLGSELASRLGDTRRLASAAAQKRCRLPQPPSLSYLPFASVKHAFDVALSSDHVAKTLAGTSVFTVSNSNNEFVLISDPNSMKSIGLLCFRKEDAEAFLAQVNSRKRELRTKARVVPITLDQVYMLKVEGIAFRFMPDPVQIKNALELKASDIKSGFDGVPIFQSDLLVVKKKNRRYCPIYFRKDDIEKELSRVSRASRGQGASQRIVVGSLEDVLKKMEMNENNSGWEDLIFIPPGKSFSEHIQVVNA